MAKDLFSEINNAVLDLQSSQLQTYERPLKKLAQLLRHPDLEPYNVELTEGLDVEEFYLTTSSHLFCHFSQNNPQK